MKTTRYSRIGAALAITTLSTAALLTAGAPAYAATAPGTVTATTEGGVKSYGAGYSKVLGDQSANTFLVKVEGGDVVEVYCIEQGVSFEFDGSVVYDATSFADSKVANVAKAASIASRTFGTPLADKNAEVSARQLAIWSLTDKTDYSKVANASMVTRADALKAAAVDLPQGITSAVLSATATQADGKNTVVASLATTSGTPIANQTVTLTSPAGKQDLKTDNKGKATATFAAAAASKATLSWSGVLPAGSVLVPASGAQKVVTTEDAKITRTAEVALAAAPAPAPEPTTPAPVVTPEAPAATPPAPVVEKPAAPEPPAEPVAKKELPYTGTTIGAPMVLGALGLVGLGLWSRRRTAKRSS